MAYLKRTSPELAARVERYNGKEPLLEKSGVAEAVNSTLSAASTFPPGGYLVFDYAEAFTVIDVNTGPLRRRPRQVVERPARGHDHEEQPRGRHRGRAPAPAARHRRDHRHRLHRHGEPEEPPARRGRAQHRAGPRPDEDLRRRDLAARPGRDDAPERHRRAARDPHRQVPDLRLDGRRRLRRDARRRGRAQAPRARRRLEGRGLPGRAALRRRGDPRRPERRAPGGAGEGDGQALRLQDEEVVPPRPLRRPRRGQGRRDRGPGAEAEGSARRALSRGAGREVEAVVALDEARSRRQTRPRSTAEAAEAAADGDQPAEKPKKKTRRGRGGRGRKKKPWRPPRSPTARPPTARAAGAGEPAEPVEAVPGAVEPSANGDAAEEKPKKKTRRGSRGGRRRKKKPPARAPPSRLRPRRTLARLFAEAGPGPLVSCL